MKRRAHFPPGTHLISKADAAGFTGDTIAALIAAEARNTACHEIAHNWDDPSETWRASSFRAISR